MAGPKIQIYRSYRFIDKDPVIDKLRTIVNDEGLTDSEAARIATLSPATTHNWFFGKTRRPQFASIAAVTSSLGYDIKFERRDANKLDKEKELAAAAKWIEQRSKNGSGAGPASIKNMRMTKFK